MYKSLIYSSAKIQALAKGLAPAFFRIGGNEADILIFNRTTGVVNDIDKDWAQYSSSDDTDWYDEDLDYDTSFTESKDSWTNFTMTGITDTELAQSIELVVIYI